MKITLHYQTKTTAEGNVCEHTTELLDGKKFPSHTNLVLKKRNILYQFIINVNNIHYQVHYGSHQQQIMKEGHHRVFFTLLQH